MIGVEGCDSDIILEAGDGESGDPLSVLSETKSPSDYIGEFTNKVSILDS